MFSMNFFNYSNDVKTAKLNFTKTDCLLNRKQF